MAFTEGVVLESIRISPSHSLLPSLELPCGSRQVSLCLSPIKVSLIRPWELEKYKLMKWGDSKPESGDKGQPRDWLMSIKRKALFCSTSSESSHRRKAPYEHRK